MLVYAGSPAKYKNAVIFAGSVIFYSMGVKKPVYIILFLLTLLFDFIIAQFIESFRRTSRLWLTVGIVFNFWWLIFFK
ncbi:MAG: MBOAT family protein, partial [Ruminococcus sp.]|nr:MBOAT family protein [Ruminococcus sp.]